jgi:hypothetical protein
MVRQSNNTTTATSMGVRMTFFQGRAKFLRGAGGPKHNVFFQKSRKTYYFGRPRGAIAPLLPSPADAHGNIEKVLFARGKTCAVGDYTASIKV